jgi:hypothetical protein
MKFFKADLSILTNRYPYISMQKAIPIHIYLINTYYSYVLLFSHIFHLPVLKSKPSTILDSRLPEVGKSLSSRPQRQPHKLPESGPSSRRNQPQSDQDRLQCKRRIVIVIMWLGTIVLVLGLGVELPASSRTTGTAII